MTLEQVRSEMQVLFCTEVTTEDLDRWSDAIDAHLGRQSEGVSDEAKLFSGDLEVLASLGFPKIADRIRAALTAVLHNRPAQEQHPDDMAVDSFALAMKVKLAEARAKGRSGWQDKDDCPQQRLSDMLRNHVEKGDPLDVADFCMFLHQRGESILPAQEKAGPVASEDQEGLAEKCQRIAQNRDYWFGVAEELRQKLLDAEKTAPAAERDVASGDSGRPWLPMASAPRDGRVVELRWGEDGIAPGWWTGDVALPFEYEPSDEYLWRFIDARSSESGEYFLNTARDNEYGPTHWRPYAPPAAERAKVPVDLELVKDMIDYAESGKVAEPSWIPRMRAMLDDAPEGDS